MHRKHRLRPAVSVITECTLAKHSSSISTARKYGSRSSSAGFVDGISGISIELGGCFKGWVSIHSALRSVKQNVVLVFVAGDVTRVCTVWLRLRNRCSDNDA